MEWLVDGESYWRTCAGLCGQFLSIPLSLLARETRASFETQQISSRELHPPSELNSPGCFVVNASDSLGKYAVRRLAAALILRALAVRAPTLFYEAHLKQPKGFGLKSAEKPQPAHIWSIIMDKEKVSTTEAHVLTIEKYIHMGYREDKKGEVWGDVSLSIFEYVFSRRTALIIAASKYHRLKCASTQQLLTAPSLH